MLVHLFGFLYCKEVWLHRCYMQVLSLAEAADKDRPLLSSEAGSPGPEMEPVRFVRAGCDLRSIFVSKTSSMLHSGLV